MRFVIAALMALTVGCSQKADRTLTFEFFGSPADEAAFMGAVAEWNDTCGAGTIEVAPGGVPVTPVETMDKPYVAMAHVGRLRDGDEWIARPTSIIYLPSVPMMQAVFAHELGHAVRGSELHDETGLMRAVSDGTVYHVTPDLCGLNPPPVY